MSMANRICKQCGTPLAPSEMFCSTCGTRYMEPAMSEPTQYASSSQYPNQYPGTPNPSQPQIEPTQYAGPSQSVPPYSSSPYASTPYGGNTSYGSSQSYAPPPPASSMTPPPMQYGTYGQPSTVPPPGQMGYQPPPQPKKGPNVGLIIGIVILLLVVVGGSIFFFTRSKSSTTNSTNTTSGSTATTQPSVQPIFSDDFASNSKNWDTTSGTGFSRLVGNHALTLSEANHKILIETFPISKTFSDVQLTATFTILQADSNDSLGLYIR